MSTKKEHLLAVGEVDPAPAGSGFGMVRLQEVRHIDGPRKNRIFGAKSFWHAFSSPEEQRQFQHALTLADHEPHEGKAPVVAVHCDGNPAGNGTRFSWLSMTKRLRNLMKHLSHHHEHKEPARRISGRFAGAHR
jgi:hypothetical protein